MTANDDDPGRRIAALMPRARAGLAELVAILAVADPRRFPPERCRVEALFLSRFGRSARG